jgi:hypothetical protein
MDIPNRDLVTDLVNHYIYRMENPDWGQLMIVLYDYGFTSGQVYDIMQSIREEGVV